MAKIRSISLLRGGCYGTCPIYEVTLNRSGSAAWEGEAFTERLGSYRGSVEAEEFELVASLVDRCGFFAWKDDYPPSGTDLPPYSITVVRGSETKQVSAWGDSPGPQNFHVIARLMDAVADRIDWEPTGDASGGPSDSSLGSEEVDTRRRE